MKYNASTGPIASEAWPFFIPLIIGIAISAVFGLTVVAWIFALLAAYVLFFFRNPQRTGPTAVNSVTCPADGKIVAAGLVPHPDFEGGQAMRIAVFMSLFDCHVNWAPVEGKVLHAEHFCGSFLNAMEDKCADENERKVLRLETAYGPVVVKLVAGLVARRIVCPVTEGDQVERGEKIGLIRFGSRVETLLPATCVLRVKKGDKVKGGETLLADFLQ